MSNNNKIGWRFDNTYSKLPNSMLTKLPPTPVKAPELVVLNHSLSKMLGLDFDDMNFKSDSDPCGFVFWLGFVLLPPLIRRGLFSILGLVVIVKG